MSHLLFLLRHAEAALAGSVDRDRPITGKGKRDAKILASKMHALKLFPDCIICSPSRRTRETCDILSRSLPEVMTLFPEKIYEASVGDLYGLIKMQSETCKSVLLIGHNPGIHGLVTSLAEHGDHEVLAKVRYGYKPCTLSVINCDADHWTDVKPAINTIKNVLAP